MIANSTSPSPTCEGAEKMLSTKYVPHPEFDGLKVHNNIALVKLSFPFPLSGTHKVIHYIVVANNKI